MRIAKLVFIVLMLVAAANAAASGHGRAKQFEAAVESAMAGRQGSAVVLDVKSGRVIGSYNLRSAATRVATPGSAIKPFVLQSLLEAKRIDGNTTFACRRVLTIASHHIDCTHPEAVGMLTAPDALAFSCNSYFVAAAARFQRGELERRLQQFGLASPTGLVQQEAVGHIAIANTLPERQLLAIGVQGIQVTPIAMAHAYRRLALQLLSSPAAVPAEVWAGLERSTAYGMGRLAQASTIKVAGKTGTASDAHDPHTHAWFAGFAPSDKPEIVVVVFLERGRGSIDAATVASRIFAAYADSRKLRNTRGAR
ncbi:MAG TPA: penicillin-binding transpeptidase domain-containing protein [Terriglobales bacterium]|nr:penicillin-binding transpeptidase domain-containing protein [Terriglobales bacterium]